MKTIYTVIQLFLMAAVLCTGCRKQEGVTVQNNVSIAVDNIPHEIGAPVLHEEETARETIESNEYPAYDFEQDNPDQPFVFIRGEKITLRYSTRDDVEKLLGGPSITQFHEYPGEEYYWYNFWTCSYGSDTLRFNFDQDGTVIRISANANYSGEVQFLGKNIKSLIVEDILNLIKNLGEEHNYYVKDGFIMYDYKLSAEVQITYSFWFYDTGRIRWLDMYYPWPWDEEN